MFAITTIGPNGFTDASFHIHEEGCRDIKQRKYFRSEKYNEKITSVEDLVTSTNSDIIEENGSPWQDYAGEFRIFPCVGDLPFTEAEANSEAIEFESLELHKAPKKVRQNRQAQVMDHLAKHTFWHKGLPAIVEKDKAWTVEVLEALAKKGLVEARFDHKRAGWVWIHHASV